MKTIKIVVLGLLISSGFTHTTESIQNKDYPFYDKNILLVVPMMAATMWLAKVAHEYGHAITLYAFTGTFPHITIGQSDHDNDFHYFDSPGITINSFSPMSIGTTSIHNEDIQSMSSFSKILLTLNGPTFGFLTIMALTSVIHKIINPTDIALLLTCPMINLELSNVLPFHSEHIKAATSDGYKLFEELGMNKDTLNTLSAWFNPLNALVAVLTFITVFRNRL